MKRIFSVITAVLLLAAALLTTSAFADNTKILQLGSITAGTYQNELQVTTVQDLQSVELKENNNLPDGLSWATRENLLFLYGNPTAAGNYTFTFAAVDTAGETTELQCTLTVNPASPNVTSGSNVACTKNDNVTLSVTASTPDGGSLSYQWYTNTMSSTVGGILIAGASSANYTPNTAAAGTQYYYCVVTNNNHGMTAQASSNPVSVTVTGISSIAVSSSRELYTVGEAVSTSDYALQITYTDGRTETVRSGFTVSPMTITASGEQSLTFTYQGETVTYAITADEPEEVVEGIEIINKPSKLTYTVGDAIDLTDLKIRVYTNLSAEGHTITITDSDNTKGIKCSVTKFASAGVQSVTITLDNQTATFNVTVNEAAETLQNIAVRTKPTKTEYTVGDTFDPAGLVIKVYYKQGNTSGTRDITEGFTCTPTTLTKAGDQLITVTYQDMTCSFRVTVKNASETASEPTPTPAAVVVTPASGASASGSSTESGSSSSSGSGSGVVIALLVIAIVILLGLIGYIYLFRMGGLEKLKNGNSGNKNNY